MSTSNDWNFELNSMLNTIGIQIEKVDQHFKAMGRPFNEEFQQLVVKLTNLKLETSFANIALTRWDERQANAIDNRCDSTNDQPADQKTPTSSVPAGGHGNEMTNHQMVNLNSAGNATAPLATRPTNNANMVNDESASSTSSVTDCNNQTTMIDPNLSGIAAAPMATAPNKSVRVSNAVVEAGHQTSERRNQNDGNNVSNATANCGNARMQIFVRICGEKTIALMVKPSDTISRVKRRIEEKVRIPSNRQRILYGGKQFEDECTLSHYNVKRDSTLHLLLRVDFGPAMRIFIVHPLSGKRIAYDVKQSDLIETVKEKVQRKQGYRPDHQHLIFNGKQLEDRCTIEHYNIRMGSTVFLVLRTKASV